MKRFPFFFALAVSTTLTAPSLVVADESVSDLQKNMTVEDKKLVCADLRASASELSDQLPVDVDYMTKLIGASAVWSGDLCRYTLQYVIDEEKYLEAEHQNLDEDVPLWFLKEFYSAEGSGYEQMKGVFRTNLLSVPEFQNLLDIEFMRIKVRYVMKGDSLDDFTINLGGPQ